MKINFRQGIVSYEQSTGGQAFLQASLGGATIDIVGDVSVAFAHRGTDYLHVETVPNNNQWTGVPTTGDVWIYWDIDPQTGLVTYGYTQVQPTSGLTQPTTLVNDLHWFDTTTNIHKVYDGTRFLERIRVFAARVNAGIFYPVGSTTASPFAGTQVGINQTAFAGQILFASGRPVIISDTNPFSPIVFGRGYVFATTETFFATNGGAQKVNTIRLESDFTTAAANENLAAYQVVKYNSAGRLEPANYNDTTATTIGIITDDANINSLATVILQGVITNEQWNWPVVGQELFILQSGELTPNDPNLTTPSLYPESKPPVARVLNSKEIIFMQGLGKVGPRGLNPEDINTIGNVEITNAQQNQVLQFDGSPQLWRNQFPLIDDLNDVEITSVAAAQGLVYSGSPLLWRNADILSADFGSPLADNDFLQYDASIQNFTNRNRRQSNVGYFGVIPNTHDEDYTFVADDAGQGIFTTATIGSPNNTTYTWTLNANVFEQGDVITLGRRFNAANINLATGANVVIQSQIDGTATNVGSPLPQFTLDNPAQATLWLVESVGSPYLIGSPQAVAGSPGTDVWLLNGTGVSTV